MDIRCPPNTLQIFSKCFTKTKQPQVHSVMFFKKIIVIPCGYLHQVSQEKNKNKKSI